MSQTVIRQARMTSCGYFTHVEFMYTQTCEFFLLTSYFICISFRSTVMVIVMFLVPSAAYLSQCFHASRLPLGTSKILAMTTLLMFLDCRQSVNPAIQVKSGFIVHLSFHKCRSMR
ncbi:hypothetical protein KP509_28G035900 [Ceratopteris richardii]|uniref:Uncharacterized protein n=1 Tax=Ceratopteris richardii TaxID=49495 RepID=A0A8T2RDQ2_CERRI|nr:hypothetical protein KP509_28G035900 [Ceratopteris richardii]